MGWKKIVSFSNGESEIALISTKSKSNLDLICDIEKRLKNISKSIDGVCDYLDKTALISYCKLNDELNKVLEQQLTIRNSSDSKLFSILGAILVLITFSIYEISLFRIEQILVSSGALICNLMTIVGYLLVLIAIGTLLYGLYPSVHSVFNISEYFEYDIDYSEIEVEMLCEIMCEHKREVVDENYDVLDRKSGAQRGSLLTAGIGFIVVLLVELTKLYVFGG